MRPLMMRALKLLLTAAVILGMAPTNMAFLPAVTRRGNAQLVPAGKRAPSETMQRYAFLKVHRACAPVQGIRR